MLASPSEFAREVDILHRLFFGGEPSRMIVEQYILAEKCFQEYGSDAFLSFDVCSLYSSGVDLEALEYYLRFRRRRNDLTRKVGALYMICETKSAYFDLFISQEDTGFGCAIAQLLLAVKRAAVKLVKGRLESKRLGLIV